VNRFLLFLLPLFFSVDSFAAWFEEVRSIMGTEVRVELWSNNEVDARNCIEKVFADMRRIEQGMSPYIETSELYRLNQQAYNKELVVSEELFELLKLSVTFSEKTQGAFDITFASVGYLYDYKAGVQPDLKQIDALLPAIDYEALVLNEENRGVRFLKRNTKIDLGGIAKGYAVDSGINVLTACGVQSALIAAGGDTRIIGDRQGYPWVVGIKSPRSPDEISIKIPLQDVAISTSGDYERFFITQGERIHHIIDPATGRSSSSVQSVSILSDRAVISDAWSTAVFVSGVRKGLELINQAVGVDAIIIDAKGKLHYSDDLLMPVK